MIRKCWIRGDHASHPPLLQMAGFIFHPQYHLEMNISSCFIPNTEQKYLLNISAFLHQPPSGTSREEAALRAKLQQSRRESCAMNTPHTPLSAGGPWGTPQPTARALPEPSPALSLVLCWLLLLAGCWGRALALALCLKAKPAVWLQWNSASDPGLKRPLPCKSLSLEGRECGAALMERDEIRGLLLKFWNLLFFSHQPLKQQLKAKLGLVWDLLLENKHANSALDVCLRLEVTSCASPSYPSPLVPIWPAVASPCCHTSWAWWCFPGSLWFLPAAASRA